MSNFNESSENKNDKILMKCQRLSPTAKLPIYSSGGAAGTDLFSSVNCIIPAQSKYLVKTGICISIPVGHYGRIAPRSGLAVKHFIDVGAGVVDEDYRGEVTTGMRIAQLIIEKFSRVVIEEVNALDLTVRGENGFGSTGI